MRILIGLGAAVAVLLGYLVLWPVPVDPVAWHPPVDAGYTGAHAANQRLDALERVPLADLTGP
ncbi:MAG: SMP-30/gluconolactonase/LRE family protein, partial [Myxococcota bacterium]